MDGDCTASQPACCALIGGSSREVRPSKSTDPRTAVICRSATTTATDNWLLKRALDKETPPMKIEVREAAIHRFQVRLTLILAIC